MSETISGPVPQVPSLPQSINSPQIDTKPIVATAGDPVAAQDDAVKPPWLTANGHINASAIVGLICALGCIWGPAELIPKFTATGIAAAGWLGASAKAK